MYPFQSGALRPRQVYHQRRQRQHRLRLIRQRLAELKLHALFRVRDERFVQHQLAGCVQPGADKVADLGLVERCAVKQHLPRRIPCQLVAQQLRRRRADRGHIHLAGRNVRKAHAARRVAPKHGRQVVVAAFVEHTAFQHGTRRHHPDDLALHQAFGGGGILHLLAYGDLVPLGDQPGDIRFRRVIRHAAHRRTLRLAALAPGQRQFQFAGRQLGIVEKHLVKIAQPVKQNAPRVFFLGFQILLHHRRKVRHRKPSRLSSNACKITIAPAAAGHLSGTRRSARSCRRRTRPDRPYPGPRRPPIAE